MADPLTTSKRDEPVEMVNQDSDEKIQSSSHIEDPYKTEDPERNFNLSSEDQKKIM